MMKKMMMLMLQCCHAWAKLPDIAGLRYASGGLCLDSTECSPQLYEREGGSGACAGVERMPPGIYISAYILAVPMLCRCHDTCRDVHRCSLIRVHGQGLPETPHR